MDFAEKQNPSIAVVPLISIQRLAFVYISKHFNQSPVFL